MRLSITLQMRTPKVELFVHMRDSTLTTVKICEQLLALEDIFSPVRDTGSGNSPQIRRNLDSKSISIVFANPDHALEGLKALATAGHDVANINDVTEILSRKRRDPNSRATGTAYPGSSSYSRSLG